MAKFKINLETKKSLSQEVFDLLSQGKKLIIREGSTRGTLEGLVLPNGKNRTVYLSHDQKYLFLNKNFRWVIDLSEGEIIQLNDISVEEFLEDELDQ